MDNQGAVYLTCGAGDSNKMKHINIRYHFIQSHVEQRHIKVQFMTTDKMTTNILIKNLGCLKHDYFTMALGIVA